MKVFYRRICASITVFTAVLCIPFIPAFSSGEPQLKNMTSLQVKVLQKHDNVPVREADVVITLDGVEYKGMTDRKGMCDINGLILNNPILGKADLKVLYSGEPVYSKKILLFNMPKNRTKIVLRGEVSTPEPPRLDLAYSYTNEKIEKFSGSKNPYSKIYINGEIAVKATSSDKWKAFRKLDIGLNTLVFTAENIWGEKSKPVIFHITYFPVSEGSIEFFDGPKNVRSERGRASSVVSWQNIPSGKVSGYNVYRTETPGGGYKKMNPVLISGTPYTDADIGKEEYFYAVTAVTDDHETGFSEEVSSIPGTLVGTDIPDRIDQDTVLTSSRSPYLVSSEVKVLEGAELRIEPGVEIRFKKGETSISGKIISEGTEDAPVIFTSAQETPQAGQWKGVKAASGSVIKNSVVQYAGRGGEDAVSLSGDSALTDSVVINNGSSGVGIKARRETSGVLISGNNISDNGGSGIYASEGARADIVGNHVEHNAGRGISVPAESNMNLNTVLSNGLGDAIEITGGEIKNNASWGKGEYLLTGPVETELDGALRLSPGVTVKAEPNVSITGKVIARGEGENNVTFTAADTSYGKAWGGLVLDDGSDLENCVISYVLGPRGGIREKGKNILLVEISSFFIEEKIGLFDLDKLSDDAMGGDNDEAGLVNKISPEILLLLAILIPTIILFLIMAFLQGRKIRR